MNFLFPDNYRYFRSFRIFNDIICLFLDNAVHHYFWSAEKFCSISALNLIYCHILNSFRFSAYHSQVLSGRACLTIEVFRDLEFF